MLLVGAVRVCCVCVLRVCVACGCCASVLRVRVACVCCVCILRLYCILIIWYQAQAADDLVSGTNSGGHASGAATGAGVGSGGGGVVWGMGAGADSSKALEVRS